MAKLKLQFIKGDGSFFNTPKGWIALAGYSVSEDGKPLLSAECVRAKEVEEAADYLKKQLDRIVTEAKKKLPN